MNKPALTLCFTPLLFVLAFKLGYVTDVHLYYLEKVAVFLVVQLPLVLLMAALFVWYVKFISDGLSNKD